jgi:putative ABC transport system permease protein
MSRRRDFYLAALVSLLTGSLLLVGFWLVRRAEDTPTRLDAQAEEIRQLHRELRTFQESFVEQPVPGGIKLTVIERDALPSRLPERYANYLNPARPDCLLDRKDVGPRDFMALRYYGGFAGGQVNRQNVVFLIATEPDAITAMMDGLAGLDPELVRRLKDRRAGCLLGRKQMEAINRRAGERLSLTGLSHQGIDLDLEIVGLLPGERYDRTGIMNAEYLTASLAAYEKKTGARHPLADKSLNAVWLRVPNRAAFERVKRLVEGSKVLSNPAITCRLSSSLPWALLPDLLP